MSVLVAVPDVDGAPLEPRPHEKFWFDDGSLLLRAENDLFKVHRTLLHRHSSVLPLTTDSHDVVVKNADGLSVVHLPVHVTSTDFGVLLEHLYHDVPLDDSASFARVASLLRVSSPEQLGFTAVHALAKTRLQQFFPSSPHTFNRPQHAEDALALAIQYDIPSIRKCLYYTVATHPYGHASLSPDTAARCDALLEHLVAHFTPIFFTVATAGHMTCTNVFAEKWMPLVIQPALDDNGLCSPLETLDRIIAVDWATQGLCSDCVRDKTDEWRREQADLWAHMDEWLS